MQFPIYSDDINYLIINSRYWIDGHIRPSIFPACPNNGQGVQTPWPLLIGLIINSTILFWVNSPLELKIFTVFLFSVWLFLLYKIRRQVHPDESNHDSLLLLFLPLSGALPLALTQGRPELPLALILLIIIYLGLNQKKAITSKILIWLMPTCIFSLHAKGVFFFPLFAYLAHQIFKSNKLKFLYYLWLILLAFTGYHHYKIIYSCNEVNKIGSLISSYNVLLNNKGLTFQDFFQNGMSSLLRHIGGLFRENISRGTNWTGTTSYLGHASLFTTSVFLSSLFIYFYSTLSFLIKNFPRNNKIHSLYLITLLLLLGFISHCWLQRLYLFYYANFTTFIFITTGTLTIPKLCFKKRNRIIISILFLNALLTTVNYGNLLLKKEFYEINNHWRNTIPSRISHLFASSKSNNNNSKQILDLAYKCDLRKSDRLIIDETTYLALKDNPLPVMSEYIWGTFQEKKASLKEIKDLDKFSGLFTRCDRLPGNIRESTTIFGDYCCLTIEK